MSDRNWKWLTRGFLTAEDREAWRKDIRRWGPLKTSLGAVIMVLLLLVVYRLVLALV